jgi:hypothetical protein
MVMLSVFPVLPGCARNDVSRMPCEPGTDTGPKNELTPKTSPAPRMVVLPGKISLYATISIAAGATSKASI